MRCSTRLFPQPSPQDSALFACARRCLWPSMAHAPCKTSDDDLSHIRFALVRCSTGFDLTRGAGHRFRARGPARDAHPVAARRKRRDAPPRPARGAHPRDVGRCARRASRALDRSADRARRNRTERRRLASDAGREPSHRDRLGQCHLEPPARSHGLPSHGAMWTGPQSCDVRRQRDLEPATLRPARLARRADREGGYRSGAPLGRRSKAPPHDRSRERRRLRRDGGANQ